MGGRAVCVLAAILLIGLALRFLGLSFGLPNVHCRPDESTLVHRALAIGAGDPARLAALGHGIFQLTEDFDNQVLAFLGRNPNRLYLNCSSGAVYGAGFATPPDATTRSAWWC